MQIIKSMSLYPLPVPSVLMNSVNFGAALHILTFYCFLGLRWWSRGTSPSSSGQLFALFHRQTHRSSFHVARTTAFACSS